jgi:dihydroorotate dehydrogenase (NAD+) catalytic subunit
MCYKKIGMNRMKELGKELEVEIGNLSFPNPLLLASGILDQTGGSMNFFFDNGAGGVVTKSVTLKAREGYKNPTLVELETGLLNAMGLPNPGIEEYRKELNAIREEVRRKRVIGSAAGGNEREFVKIAEGFEKSGVAAVELNLSCPHAHGYGAELGSNPTTVKKITQEVVSAVSLPVWAKLPVCDKMIESGIAAESGGASAVVAINTLKGIAIDPEFSRPILANRIGGYSGPGIKPVALRVVYELSERLDIPIIGCGGVTNGLDVVEFINAGASAVELGSAVFYRGRKVFSKIERELRDWFVNHPNLKLMDIIGAAHKA